MQRQTVDYVHTRHAPENHTQVAHDKVVEKHTVKEETTEVLEDHVDPTGSEESVSIKFTFDVYLQSG